MIIANAQHCIQSAAKNSFSAVRMGRNAGSLDRCLAWRGVEWEWEADCFALLHFIPPHL